MAYRNADQARRTAEWLGVKVVMWP